MTYQAAIAAHTRFTPAYATYHPAKPLARAQQCFESDWRLRSYADRALVLSRVATRMRQTREVLAAWRMRDMGALRAEALADVDLAAETLAHYAAAAAIGLAPRAVPHGPYRLEPKPLGIILGVDCGYASYADLAQFAGSKLMAGNVVLMTRATPSSRSDCTFAALFAAAGAPAGLYTSVVYNTEDIAGLIDDTRLRGVEILGRSCATALIAEHATRRHKHVVQDVSRNHVLVVLEDAPLDRVLDGIMERRAGQAPLTSVSARRVILVGRARERMIADGLRERLCDLRAGDPSDAMTTQGPLPSDHAVNILLHHIQVARYGGARVAFGGERSLRPGFFVQPTLLTKLSASDPISSHAIHGPIVTLHATASVEEAIKAANLLPVAAGSRLLTGDPAQAAPILRRLPTQFAALPDAAFVPLTKLMDFVAWQPRRTAHAD